MKLVKKFAVLFMSATMAMGSAVLPVTTQVQAEIVATAGAKISDETLTMKPGDTHKLKVKGTKKKAKKWKSNDPSVATVNKKGKVTALAAGTTVITAKVGKKELVCTVTVEDDSFPIDGGWTTPESPVVTEDIMKAVESVALDGVSYLPVAVLKTQVVAGVNYRLLCVKMPVVAEEAEVYYSLLTLNVDAENNASFKDIVDTAWPAGKGDGAGSWIHTDSPEVTIDAQAALELAAVSDVGVSYDALALIETQVVEGINYLLVCDVAAVAPESAPVLSFVVVNAGADGSASITDVVTIEEGAKPTDPTNPVDPVDPVVGAWEPYDKIELEILPAGSKEIFEAAMASFDGIALEPAAQLLTFTTEDSKEYIYLAKEKVLPETATSGWFIVNVEKTGEDNPIVKSEIEFDPENLLILPEAPEPGTLDDQVEVTPLSDGITLPTEPVDVWAAFNEAKKNYAVQFSPLALLATKVVNGTDYLIFCVDEVAGENNIPEFYFVTLNISADGVADFTDAEIVDLVSYIQIQDI